MVDENTTASAEPAATTADVPAVVRNDEDRKTILRDVAAISRPTIPASVGNQALPAAAEPDTLHAKIDALHADAIANSGMSAEHVGVVHRMVQAIKDLVA